MKDINNKKVTIPKEAVYKDVVIIGNGPSGITMSYMLSGHWPYWLPDRVAQHPDELLRARLNFADSSISLVEQDLANLADGLEGRSTNPVSLLLDSLQNPGADIGMEVPSMLQYKYHADKEIDHVVLGKGPPGGSWHRMDPNLRTLSLSAWMSLPGLDFNKWVELHPEKDADGDGAHLKSNQKTNEYSKCAELNHEQRVAATSNTSAATNNNATEIGDRCCRCLKNVENIVSDNQSTAAQSISSDNNNNTSSSNSNSDLFVNNSGSSKVTFDVEVSLHKNNTIGDQLVSLSKVPRRNLSVKRQISKEVQMRALVSRVAKYYEMYVQEMGLSKYLMNDTEVTAVLPLHGRAGGRYKNGRWLVFAKGAHKSHIFVCRNLILATGASDLANRLGLPDENNSQWVKHDLTQLEDALKNLSQQERSNLKPVLVVGAGLSAADAVTICRSSGVNVIHVYRNRSVGLDKMLPENVYPEYHEVHKMMKDSQNVYDLYNPLPEHTITNVLTTSFGHKVIVQHLTTGVTKELDISYCAILIGSRPDLRFLTHIVQAAITDGKENRHPTIDELILRETSELSSTLDNTRNGKCMTLIRDMQCVQQSQHWSLMGKKIAWFKNLCAKCRHLNICEWSRRNNNNDKCKRNCCLRNQLKYCENGSRVSSQWLNAMPKTTTVDDAAKLAIVLKYPTYDVETKSIIGLGEDDQKPIDCKTNPIAVDKFTNEMLRTQKGLYSMGPLVGDNFIRFIPGGALAITAALHKEND